MDVTITGSVPEKQQVLVSIARWCVISGPQYWKGQRGNLHFDISGTAFTPRVQFDLGPVRAGAIAVSIVLALFMSVTHLAAPALAEPIEHAFGVSAGVASDVGVTETFSSLSPDGTVSEASDTSFGLPFESQRPAVPTVEPSPTPPMPTATTSPTATALPSPTATAKPTATARPTKTTAPTVAPTQAPTTEPTVAPASAPSGVTAGPTEKEKEKQDPPGQSKEPPGQEKNPSKPNPPDPPGQEKSPAGQGKR